MRVLLVGAMIVVLLYGEAQAARKIYEPPFHGVLFDHCYDGDTCTVSLPGLPAIFGDHTTP